MEIYKKGDNLYHITGRKVAEHHRGERERTIKEVNEISLEGANTFYKTERMSIRGVDKMGIEKKYPLIKDYPSLRDLIGKEIQKILYTEDVIYFKVYCEDEILNFKRIGNKAFRIKKSPNKEYLEFPEYLIEEHKEHIIPSTIIKLIREMYRKKEQEEWKKEQEEWKKEQEEWKKGQEEWKKEQEEWKKGQEEYKALLGARG